MMKTLLIFGIACFSFFANAQRTQIDSIKKALTIAKDDTTRLQCLNWLFFNYIWSYSDSAAPYAQEGLQLAKKINKDHYLKVAYMQIGILNQYTGNYLDGLVACLEGIKIAELSPVPSDSTDRFDLSALYLVMGTLYMDIGDFDNSISYLDRANHIFELQEWRDPRARTGLNVEAMLNVWQFKSHLYTKFNQLDSALKYAQLLDAGNQKSGLNPGWPVIPYIFGNIYLKMGEYEKAVEYYHSTLSLSTRFYTAKDRTESFEGLAKTYKITGQLDSSIFYAHKVLSETSPNYFPHPKMVALDLLADIYHEKNKGDSVAKFLGQSAKIKDSLFGEEKIIKIQKLTFSEHVRQVELSDQLRRFQEKLILYSTIAALLVFLTIAFILWRSNRHKEKAYALLQVQKQETDLQKAKVEKTLEELKVAQAQLIQSEKMASLGELTAGIAHEIQNPINFINNFSEINTELIDETRQLMHEGNSVEVLKLLTDLRMNEEKVKYHGQRVDAIVKGMLQHSRKNSGQKEPTDINNLAAEYLRLSYHGLRAKDKSFHATMQTSYDENIGLINIIPQDIGRVLLNLYNNAFYAVAEKEKQSDENYKPTVSVSTKKITDKIEIRVRDNGNGIPQKVLDKIFQPFFTTKPTGLGTGLGLSISYDIIKAHGGEIKVETLSSGQAGKESQFTEFIIQLPV